SIRDRLARAEGSIRAARAGGGLIGAGGGLRGGSGRGHPPGPGGGGRAAWASELSWEVESVATAVLEPWEALGAATWRGGDLLGEPDAGVIREGGPATFVLVRGDPYSDPAALRRIVPG